MGPININDSLKATRKNKERVGCCCRIRTSFAKMTPNMTTVDVMAEIIFEIGKTEI